MDREKEEKKNRYDKIKKLGEGAYGCVNKVYDHESKTIKALKKIKFTNEDQGIPVSSIRQISYLRKLDHPNIIKLYDVHYNWEHSKLYMALQFMQENLYEHLRKNHPLSPYAIKSYSFQILKALEYLHTNGIMHRDLKLQNILVSSNGSIKLCDFGQAKYSSLDNENHTNEVATLWYRAPQILLGSENYSFAVDLWSVGCIMGELASGDAIFKSNSEIGQIFTIFQSRGTPHQHLFLKWQYLSPQFPKFKPTKLTFGNRLLQPQKFNSLLEDLLQIDPKKRIGAFKALKHQYFDGYV